MRTLLVAAGLGLLLSAPLASAQSLAGISFDDTEAKVLKALPGATSVATEEDPSLRLALTAKKTVRVCKGAVYAVQHVVSSSVTGESRC